MRTRRHTSTGRTPTSTTRSSARIDPDISRLVGATQDDRTTFVITADHGHIDGGGHGGWEDAVTRVPAVFVGPGVTLDRGEIDQVDIAPTARPRLGLRPPRNSAGKVREEVVGSSPEAVAAGRAQYREQAERYLEALEGSDVTLGRRAHLRGDRCRAHGGPGCPAGRGPRSSAAHRSGIAAACARCDRRADGRALVARAGRGGGGCSWLLRHLQRAVLRRPRPPVVALGVQHRGLRRGVLQHPDGRGGDRRDRRGAGRGHRLPAPAPRAQGCARNVSGRLARRSGLPSCLSSRRRWSCRSPGSSTCGVQRSCGDCPTSCGASSTIWISSR